MKKVYKMDVQLCATAYVKAKSAREAQAKIENWIYGRWFELQGEDISSAAYSSPLLPDISLSPAMTGYPLPDAKPAAAGE